MNERRTTKEGEESRATASVAREAKTPRDAVVFLPSSLATHPRQRRVLVRRAVERDGADVRTKRFHRRRGR